MKKSRIIIFALIISICAIAIGVTIAITMTENDYNNALNKNNFEEISEDQTNLIKTNFDNIFQNNITGESENIEKNDAEEQIVFTSAQKVEIIPNKYDLDVQIPQINIKNSQIDNYNNEIKSIFQNKTVDILTNTDVYTVYNVKYHAYINNNILSLIIKAKLKEGTNPERTIIKTYNYNLESNKLLTINELMQYKDLDINQVQEKINEEIKSRVTYEESLSKLGYETFSRDINSEMYKVENTTNFIIGENGYLYLIYAYGNTNFTSELDLVIL